MRAVALAVVLVSSATAQPSAPSRAQGVVLEVGERGDPFPVLEDALRRALEDGSVPAPPRDEWLARDKALHAGGSFLLTLSGQYLLTDKTRLEDGDALPVAAGAALALGLLKEVADSRRERHPHFCWRDLAADAAGVALGAAVIAL